MAAVWALGLPCTLGWPCVHACESVADSSRIAVAGGSLTEIIYFLGAGQRLVAVDTTSNYPAAAQELPSIGYVRALSAEGLLSLNPTLVLGEHDMGPAEVVASLQSTGLPIVHVPETPSASGIVAKVRCVAAVLGLSEHAEALIEARLQPLLQALAELPAERSDRAPVRAVVLLGIRDGAPIGAGAGTSAHGLLEMAGARNALTDFQGWKPVAVESMADARADFVVMPKRGVTAAGGVAEVLRHPAVALAIAGRSASDTGRSEDRLIVMDGMEMLGFGPRTLSAALRLAELLHTQTPLGRGRLAQGGEEQG